MRRLILRERGRIHRLRSEGHAHDDTLDTCWLEAHLYDRLMEYDLTREDKAIFDWRVNEAMARQWVGVVKMPGLLLELLPKIDSPDQSHEMGLQTVQNNLLAMLEESGNVPFRIRDRAGLKTEEGPLHEALISLFARQLRSELLCGADRGYVHLEDDLRLLRGKLVIRHHVTRNAARRDRFTCAFDEFTEDTPLNRVLKAACRELLVLTRSTKSHEALRHCLELLRDVTDEFYTSAMLDQVTLTRQNARFADLFAFCRLILSQRTPTISKGQHTVFSLLYNMDRVFEGFATSMVQRAVRKTCDKTRVYPQARTKRRHLLESNNSGVLNLKPDILIEGPAGLLVIDVKWKRHGTVTKQRQAGLSEADAYQLYAYSKRYGAKRSILLFPYVPGSIERNYAPLMPDGEQDGSQISLRYVQLHRNLRHRSEFESLVDELASMIF